MRVCLIAAFVMLGAPASLDTVQEGNTLEFRSGDRTVLRYRFAGTPYKPYADVLTTPSGLQVLLDGPEDHLHHHGLMFAVRLNGTNFWEEGSAPGRQTQTALETLSGGFRQHLAWAPESGEPISTEVRTVRVHALPDNPVTLLSWNTHLSALGIGEVELTGAHYHGLGLRFVRDMDVTGTVLTPSDDPGELVRGSELLRRGAWCAYQDHIDEQPVTVAMFDHPSNPRAATWFNMTEPFAYMSATLNSHRVSLEFRDLYLRYGVAVWDGHVSKETIEQVYQQWLALGNDGGNGNG